MEEKEGREKKKKERPKRALVFSLTWHEEKKDKEKDKKREIKQIRRKDLTRTKPSA